MKEWYFNKLLLDPFFM